MLTRWLYFRLLGATTLVAVLSYWWQLPGLSSHRGLAPAAEYIAQLRQGGVGFFEAPTLLWWWPTDTALHLLCALATLGALLITLDIAPRAALATTWMSWLSLVQTGAPFLNFQWDIMLLETLLFSIPYAPAHLWPRSSVPAPEPAYFARALVFLIAVKVTLESGLVKLLSGDPTWRNLTALTYHWWSQPLPTWSAYLAAQWPLAVQQLLCLTMFVLELIAPALAFGPKPLRRIAGLGMISLQLALIALGNFAYFNWLTLAVCVPLLDDELIRRMLPPRWPLPTLAPSTPASPRWSKVGLVAFVAVALVGAQVFLQRLGVRAVPAALHSAISPFSSINSYGAFAVMTKNRAEIIIEGSVDGTHWLPYDFKHKPGRLDRRPDFVAPWQPRLDWQMWFASLSTCGQNPWLLELQRQLMLGNDAVTSLLETDPFSGTRPTRMRTTSYEYRFAPLQAKGQWWVRTYSGPYCPELELDAAGRLQRAQ